MIFGIFSWIAEKAWAILERVMFERDIEPQTGRIILESPQELGLADLQTLVEESIPEVKKYGTP